MYPSMIPLGIVEVVVEVGKALAVGSDFLVLDIVAPLLELEVVNPLLSRTRGQSHSPANQLM